MLTCINKLKESATGHDLSVTDNQTPRAPYGTPRLLDYGRVADLTAGGSAARTSEFFNGCSAQALLFRC